MSEPSSAPTPKVTSPLSLSAAFATTLRSNKGDFVQAAGEVPKVQQHGAASITMDDWPGWADGLALDEQVIETYVAKATSVQATSDNEPFVSTWMPLVEWMNTTVRSALTSAGVELDGDAYVTASLTDVAELEGTAHMDDDQFVPGDSVGVVAIIGQHVGPRVAIGELMPRPLRAMSQVIWSDQQLRSFENDQIDHCDCLGDQLVVFPQFGQLHAGPATTHLGAATSRQLLVYRAAVVPLSAT